MDFPERPGQQAGTIMLTVGEAAQLVDRPREKIDRAIKRGRLPFTRVEGRRMVSVDDLRHLQARGIA